MASHSRGKIMASNALLFTGYLIMLFVVVIRLFFKVGAMAPTLPYMFLFAVALVAVGHLCMLGGANTWQQRRLNGMFAISVLLFFVAAGLFFVTKNSWVVALILAFIFEFWAFYRQQGMEKE